MTDPGMADRTYIGPMTPELVEQILAKVGTWPSGFRPYDGIHCALNVRSGIMFNFAWPAGAPEEGRGLARGHGQRADAAISDSVGCLLQQQESTRPRV